MQYTKDNKNPHINCQGIATSLFGNNKQSTLAEEYVNLLTSSAVPKVMMLQEIQQAITENTTLQCLMHLTQTQLRVPQFRQTT